MRKGPKLWILHVIFCIFQITIFSLKMLPENMKDILLQKEGDPPDFFRFKYHNNHPYLESVGLECVNTSNENGYITTKTLVHWLDERPKTRLESVRLEGAYDSEGQIFCITEI